MASVVKQGAAEARDLVTGAARPSSIFLLATAAPLEEST